MSTPLVSVVTPVYNGAEFLSDCIQSVRDQTFGDYEHVIIDNVSTDDTARIAEAAASSDERIRVVSCDEFLGIYGNHNRALAEVDPGARYIKMLHADDTMMPRCLEQMVDVAERNPSVGVVGSYRLVDTLVDLDSIPLDREVISGRDIVSQCLTGGPYVTGSPSSLLLRSSIVAGGGFYDESFWHADTEAIYRALRGCDFGFVHQVLTYTRLHDGANTPFCDRIKTYAPENIRMLVRHGPWALSPDAYRRQIRSETEQYLWFLTKQRVKPSRRRDPDFHRYHLSVIDELRREVDDRKLQAALAVARSLLKKDVAESVDPTVAAVGVQPGSSTVSQGGAGHNDGQAAG